ncbi:glutathione S-transferase family protein [Kaarinaea lacus]
MMKFYMTPGSCSTGIHILLEELEKVFEVYIVNLPAGDQYKPDYIKINPKSTIPTLVRDDGKPLTEFQAIAYWLARSNPEAGLLPEDLENEVLALEAMDYIVGTIHMQGFARIFNTSEFSFNQQDQESVKARGKQIVEKGFVVINRMLKDREYVAGKFSIADAALFYVEFWADKINLNMPEHCLAHYRRMLKRPAVYQVLREEGYQVKN